MKGVRMFGFCITYTSITNKVENAKGKQECHKEKKPTWTLSYNIQMQKGGQKV